MSNKIPQLATIQGPTHALKLLLPFFVTREHLGTVLDFQAITPMPESLHVTVGSESQMAESILNHREGQSEDLLQFLAYPWVKAMGITDLDVLTEHMLDHRSGLQDLITTLQENQKQHGHRHWKTWRLEHWGSWCLPSEGVLDTRRLEAGEVRWSYLLPLGIPTPIFERLQVMFPDLTFQVKEVPFSQVLVAMPPTLLPQTLTVPEHVRESRIFTVRVGEDNPALEEVCSHPGRTYHNPLNAGTTLQFMMQKPLKTGGSRLAFLQPHLPEHTGEAEDAL